MFHLNGKKISIEVDLTIGSGEDAITYPAGSLRSAELRAELGIVEVADPARPDERFHFVTEAGDGSLTVTPKPIDGVISMVWEWIKTHRDALQEAGCQVGAAWYHNDVKSRTQWERMVNRAAGMADADPYLIAGQQVAWKTMDGTFVPLDAGLIRAVVAAFEVQEALIFGAAEAHKAALGQLPDVAAIAAYDWKAGWPDVYVPVPAP